MFKSPDPVGHLLFLFHLGVFFTKFIRWVWRGEREKWGGKKKNFFNSYFTESV